MRSTLFSFLGLGVEKMPQYSNPEMVRTFNSSLRAIALSNEFNPAPHTC